MLFSVSLTTLRFFLEIFEKLICMNKERDTFFLMTLTQGFYPSALNTELQDLC